MRAAALAFFGGVLCVQQLPKLLPLWWALALIPLFWLAWREPRWLMACFFVVGGAWATYRAELILADGLTPELEGKDLVVEGHIADIPQYADYGVRFEFEVARGALDGAVTQLPRRILLNIAEPGFNPRVGENWRLTVRLKRRHGIQNPGGFDYEALLFRQRLGAKGYVRLQPPPERLFDGSASHTIGRLRQYLGDRIHSALPENPFAGVVVALANGDGRGIDETQWQVFRRTGTLHLVAISGLHISLVAGLVFFLARFAWSWPGVTVLRVPAPVVGAICGLVAATLYAALAGFVVPTQRALIMLAVAMGAIVVRRRLPVSQVLAIALLLVLVHDPLAVMATGFWLSFAAVAVIVYAMNGDGGARTWWRKWGYVQWAIALGMLPLTLWLFQRASLTGPVANMLAVPVFDLLAVPLTLAGMLALPLSDAAATLLFQLAAWLLALLWQPLSFLSALDYGQWMQASPPIGGILCAVVGVGWLLAPRGFPARAVGIAWLLPALIVRPAAPAPGEVWFTLLDVGQGLSAVVRTHSHVLLYDAGARLSPRFDLGALAVLPYLNSQGITRIDTLIASHGDNDHVGGVPTVMQGVAVVRVLSSVPDRIGGEPCQAGQVWQWDGIEFRILSPFDGAPDADNNGSCVLRVRAPYGTILLPGDIEKKAESALLERVPGDLSADILIAPHHGSRTSSTPEFLAAVQPRYVLFPVGYRNVYRHPHPLVRQRYADTSARLYDSAASGAIDVRLSQIGIEVSRYRESHRHYWSTAVAPVTAAP